MLKYALLLILLASCSGNPLGDERSTRDNDPPVGATISGWQWDLSSPDNSSLSNDNTPVVDLTNAGEEEGGKVRIYSDSICSTQVGSTRTIRSGSTNHNDITFDSTGLDDGLIEFFAIVEDISLNESECTPTGLSYTLAAGSPLVNISSPTVISQANESSYSLAGQCSEPGFDVIVQIASLGAVNIACQVDNTWLLAGVNVSALAQGSLNVTADHMDADSVSAPQFSATILKDTISPSLVDVQSFSWSLSSPVGGSLSNDTTPILSLSGANVEEAGSVSVFSDNTCVNDLETNLLINSGALSANNISYQNDGSDDGLKSFYVIVSDVAGNPSICIDTLQNYNLDTIDPTLAVLSAPQITASNQGSYTLSGSCSETGSQVSVSLAGISAAPQPTCSGSNTWSATGLDLSVASEGDLGLVVTHQDQATNSVTLNLVVNKDTTAPSPAQINSFTWGLSSPSNSSISNDTTPQISLSNASIENGASVQIFDNSACSSSQGGAQVITAGSTSHTDIVYQNNNSDDGTINFFVIITDTANNVSNCVDTGLGYTLDTADPVVTLNAPIDITSSNASSYSLSGTCSEPGIALNVSVGALNANPQPICNASNTWSITGMNVNGAAEGSLNIIARLTDLAGNMATNAIATINKDAIAPTQAEIQSLNWSLTSPASASISNDITPILNMSGAAIFENGSVQVFGDSSCSSSISSSVTINSGATSHSDISFLNDGSADGLKNFYVIVSDAGGNPSSCVDTLVSYTLDTIDANVTLSISDNINSLNQANYSVSGTCSEIGESVVILIGGISVAPQPNCVAGNTWVVNNFDATGLPQGNVLISVDHSDASGNSATTQTQTVIKDSLAPTGTQVQGFSWALVAPLNGSVSGNFNPEITLSGAGSENAGEAQLYTDPACSVATGSPQTIVTGQTNHNDLIFASDGTQDGAVTFFVIVSDSFDNPSSCVDISLGYTLDTQPPSVSITNAPAISSLNQANYSLSGVCSDIGEDVVVSVGGVSPGANPICSAGNIWTLNNLNVSVLAEGVVIATADHQDAGGNSAPTDSFNIIKDVTAPSEAEVQALSWSLTSPNASTTSSDNTPIVNLVAASSLEAGIVRLFGNASCTVTRGASQTIASGVSAHNDIILANDGSVDGPINFFAIVSDAAGNPSTCVDISLDYILDTTVAVVGLNLAAEITTSNEVAYSLSGTCSEVNEPVTILIGGIAPATAPICEVTNNWTLSSIDVSTLLDGNVLIQVNHQDIAGNPAVEQTQIVNKDTTGPSSAEIISWTWSLSSPLLNSFSSDVTPQVSLSGANSEESGSIQLFSDAVCSSAIGSVQTISSGATNHNDIIFANDGSADGLKQFFVIASDSLSNPSACTNISLEYTLDTIAPTQPELLSFTWSLSSPDNASNSQDTTPVITLSNALSENGGSVQVFDNVTCSVASSKGSSQNISAGSSFHNDLSYLTDGTDDGLISFYIRLTDQAGNSSNCVDISLGYTLDTSLPMVAITSAADITTVNQANYSLSGTCSENMQIVVLNIGGVIPSVAPICNFGSWNITGIDVSLLSDGAITITANHSDGFGNDALEDNEIVDKDTTAPSSTDILGWSWGQVSPNASTISDDGTPIVNMSGAVGEDGSTVQLFTDPVCFETAGSSQVITAGSTDHNDINFAVDGSADGAIIYYVTVTDSSNNVSDCVDISLGYTLDSVAPTTVEIQGLDWSLVSPLQASVSNIVSPTVSLSNAIILENGSVQLYSDSICTSTLGASQIITTGATSHNDFTFANDGSEDGIKRFYVVITDPGNNISNCVDISLNYILDTIAPVVAITSAPDITNGTQASYSLSGTCDFFGAEVIVSVGGISPAINPVCTVGDWEVNGLDVSSLAEGSLLVTVNMNDNAGNAAPTASLTINKDTSGPSNPSSLVLTDWADPEKSETLTWIASTDDMAIDRYEVRLESSSATLVNWIDIGNVLTYTFVDGVDGANFTLLANTDYFISVRAFDNDGNVSANIRSAAFRFFRPTFPVGLVLWFDMSDTSTLFQNTACTTPVSTTGDPVACVQSLAGSNNFMTTSTAGDSAVFDASLGALSFNGTSHGNYVMNQATTNNSIIAVARLDSGYADGAGLFNQGSNLNNHNFRIDQTSSCFRANSENNEDASDFTFGLSTSLRLNSIREECVIEDESFIMVANSNASSTYLFQLGQQDSGRFWRGSVQEVIVYNNTTPTSTAENLEGYLACKWDLRDKLDPAHPYYNSDPVNNDGCP